MAITAREQRQRRRNEALQLISKDTRAAAHQWHQSNDWEVLLMLARPHPVLGWLHFEESPAKGRAFCCLAFWLVYCLESFHVEVAEGLEVIAIKVLDDL